MSLVAFCSAKASPGTTTLALAVALAWPLRGTDVLMIEADQEGGALAARLGLGYEPGLSTLAVAARRGSEDVDPRQHSQQVAPGVSVVCAPASGAHAASATSAVARDARANLRLDEAIDAFVDLGRLSTHSAFLELKTAADVVLLVARPAVDEVQYLPSRVDALTAVGCRVGLVCVGDRPYPPAEVAAVAGTDLVGVVADDPRGAQALVTGPAGERAWRRSLL